MGAALPWSSSSAMASETSTGVLLMEISREESLVRMRPLGGREEAEEAWGAVATDMA